MRTIYLKSTGMAALAAVVVAVIWETGTLAVARVLVQRAMDAQGDAGGFAAVSVLDLTPFAAVAAVAAFGVTFWLTHRRLKRNPATRPSPLA